MRRGKKRGREERGRRLAPHLFFCAASRMSHRGSLGGHKTRTHTRRHAQRIQTQTYRAGRLGGKKGGAASGQ